MDLLPSPELSSSVIGAQSCCDSNRAGQSISMAGIALSERPKSCCTSKVWTQQPNDSWPWYRYLHSVTKQRHTGNLSSTCVTAFGLHCIYTYDTCKSLSQLKKEIAFVHLFLFIQAWDCEAIHPRDFSLAKSSHSILSDWSKNC